MAKFWIHTDRLSLRPYREDDLDVVSPFLADAETMSFYAAPYSLEKVQGMILTNRKTWGDSNYGMMVVFETGSGGAIGDCGITIQNIDGSDEYEVGYRFDKRVWGKGYASEAAMAVIQYGFQTLGLSRLYSYMPSDHSQSRRVAEKCGMVFVKEFRNPRNRGKLTSVYSIASSKKEWQI